MEAGPVGYVSEQVPPRGLRQVDGSCLSCPSLDKAEPWLGAPPDISQRPSGGTMHLCDATQIRAAVSFKSERVRSGRTHSTASDEGADRSLRMRRFVTRVFALLLVAMLMYAVLFVAGEYFGFRVVSNTKALEGGVSWSNACVDQPWGSCPEDFCWSAPGSLLCNSNSHTSRDRVVGEGTAELYDSGGPDFPFGFQLYWPGTQDSDGTSNATYQGNLVFYGGFPTCANLGFRASAVSVAYLINSSAGLDPSVQLEPYSASPSYYSSVTSQTSPGISQAMQSIIITYSGLHGVDCSLTSANPFYDVPYRNTQQVGFAIMVLGHYGYNFSVIVRATLVPSDPGLTPFVGRMFAGSAVINVDVRPDGTMVVPSSLCQPHC
jgi:hypothetical protein